LGQVAFAISDSLAVHFSLLLNVFDVNVIEVLVFPSADHVSPFADRTPKLFAVLVFLVRLFDIVKSIDFAHVQGLLVVLDLSLLFIKNFHRIIVFADKVDHIFQGLFNVQIFFRIQLLQELLCSFVQWTDL
jgi:hypothetical protein